MPARLLATTVATLLLTAAPALAGDPVMALSQVHPGMACTGYTVIHGTEIVPFGVDVQDVIDGDGSGGEGPRILIGVSGPAVEATGIGPGFSGSPIYCPDGAGVQRNIGAISESIGEYGGKVALATPIEAILGTPPDAPAPKDAAAARRARALAARARPLASPLTVSGVDRTLGRALEAAGRKAGRPVLATPAGPLGTFAPQTLRPGSAVGVSYSSGDIQVGAIGTVAYTDEDRVWAFGHPFEGSGRRRLLLQDAYVYRVVDNPLQLGDFGTTYKLASLGHTLGEISNDATSAVAGRVGSPPPTVPVRITGNDLDTGKRLFLGLYAADESQIGLPEGASPASFVGSLGVTQAASSLLDGSPGRLTGEVCFQIELHELPKPIHFCNRYVSSLPADADFVGTSNTIGARASTDLYDAITAVDSYQGRPPVIDEIAVRMDLRRGEQRAFLRSVRLPSRVRPGQRVNLKAKLRKVRGDVFTRTYRVRIPRDIRPGTRRMRFNGADADFAEDGLFSTIILDDEGDGGGDPGPATLEDLADAVRSLRRWDGVGMRAGGDRQRAFRDASMRISGRASTTVRVLERR